MKRKIRLENGLLLITILKDGELLLGEIKRGKTTKLELKLALQKEGFVFGIMEDNLRELALDYKGQLPIARSVFEFEKASVKPCFGKEFDFFNYLDLLRLNQLEQLNFSYRVRQGDDLVTVLEPPRYFLRYPDGRRRLLETLPMESISSIVGVNTRFLPSSKTIVARADGIVNLSPQGVVSVYPLKTMRALGKMLGKLHLREALYVEEDVQRESYVYSPSNVEVGGTIKSSFIKCDGNLQCALGIDDPLNWENARIFTGQNVLTAYLKNYKVWAGGDVFVKNRVDKSTVHCMNNMVAPVVSGSQIHIANKLFVKRLESKTQVYLGPTFVENSHLEEKRRNFRQHTKRLNDLEKTISKEKFWLEFNRNKALQQLQKMHERKNTANKAANLILKRFYDSLADGLRRLEDQIMEYQRFLETLDTEYAEIQTLEQHMKKDYKPEIVVLDRIEPGVIIHAPNETLKVRETMTQVVLELDEVRGILKIRPFKLK